MKPFGPLRTASGKAIRDQTSQELASLVPPMTDTSERTTRTVRELRHLASGGSGDVNRICYEAADLIDHQQAKCSAYDTLLEGEIDPAILSDRELILCLNEMRRRDLDALAASPSPRSPGREWQPIETAPKDGMFLIANALGEVCPCQSRDGSRIVQNMPGFADWSYGDAATHWMPLPALPHAEEGGAQWTDEQIDAATRVFCAGLPLETDDRSKTLAGMVAQGRCMAPKCKCWEGGREVTRAALNAAVTSQYGDGK